jgi:hypothetical protein
MLQALRLIQVQPLEQQSFFERMRRGLCLVGAEAPSLRSRVM